MSDVVISIEGLSKQYKIGRVRQQIMLREQLTELALSPIRRARDLLRGHAYGAAELDETVWALKDVSVEIKRGEIAGIIGRNGAGKTTLLKVLSQITTPTEGRVQIRGKVGCLLEVGAGFHPELTGRENIYLNGAILGMKRAELRIKFDEMVEFADLQRFIDTPVKHYSSGMYVRLAFAVAAHLEPEILFVDEVLAVGDTAFQKKCIGKMGEVAQGGRTVLFVSHNLFSLQNLCTSGILLDSGRLAARGNISEVIEAYLAMGIQRSGAMCWSTPAEAPGNDRVRLKAVRVTENGSPTATVDIDASFRIEVEYWNLVADERRWVSIHLYNGKGICVFTSANLPSTTSTPDLWYGRPYPVGLFRTSCTIPGCFLNDGIHSISVFVCGPTRFDKHVNVKEVLTFTVHDTGTMREEFSGTWIGAVRPLLEWSTEHLT